MTKECVSCGKQFVAKRSDAKTCSDACRAQVSRRKRDPKIGSSERRENQLDGLNQKYTYRQRGQARKELQKLGIVPTGWQDNEPASFSRDTHDPILWYGRKAPQGRWSPSDGWWLYEPLPTSVHDRHFQAAHGPGHFVTTGGPRIYYAFSGGGEPPRRVVEDSGFERRRRWIPGDGSEGRELPADRDLSADDELHRARFDRMLRQEQHRKGRRLNDPERAVLLLKAAGVTVTRHIKGKEMTDNEIALDVQELAELVRRILPIVARLQRRFPSSSMLQDTIDAFIYEALAAS